MTHQERAELALRNLGSAVEHALRRHGDNSTVTISDAEFDDVLSDIENLTNNVNAMMEAKIANAPKAAAAAASTGEPAPA